MKKAFFLFLLIVVLAPLDVNAGCSKKVADNGFIKETLDVYFTPDQFGPKPYSLNDWCYDKENNHLLIVIKYEGQYGLPTEASAKDLAKSIGKDMLMTSRTMKQVNQPISRFQEYILSKGVTVIITWPGRKNPAAWEKVR